MVAPPARPKLKSAFRKARSIGPLYTGGPVAVSQDGAKLITCVGEEAILTEVSSGTELCRFAGDTESITSLCISPSSSHLLLFTASLSLRIYDIPTGSSPLSKPVQPLRVVSRAHDAPIHVCRVDPTSTYLASGSADGVVKVWDIVRGYVTHAFKGHGGVVSALVFNYPRDASSVVSGQKMQLITASMDTHLRVFDLSVSASKTGASKPQAVLEGHVSVPRGLDVSVDGKWLISGGRDSVVLVWDLSGKFASKEKSNKSKGKEKESSPPVLVKTIPTLERVEAVGLLHVDENLPGSSSDAGQLRFYTGGEKGVLKIWDARGGTVLTTLGKEETNISDEQEEQRQIVDVIYIPSTSTLVSVHADQNILFHSLSTLTLSRQLIGFNDEIVDAKFLSPNEPDSHLALATNSSQIRVYSTTNLDARLLSGHTEVVLCLDHSPDGRVLASGSKDKSARIWAYGGPDDYPWTCVAVCEGHAESVGAIAMSRKSSSEKKGSEDRDRLTFMFTGSQDRTIKMWDLLSVPTSSDASGEITPVRCKSLTTHKAHEKDINALDVAPNDRLLASGSQDKTTKVYEIEYSSSGAVRGEIKQVGICRGHKRGVWTVRFGKTERVLATGSGDKTVKLWNLDDFSCVKTFEGHTNSILRVEFVNLGMQMLSSASDGLVKLWNVREEECVATMDNHEDKIWALTVSSDEQTIVSGAADSVVTFWQDSTEEEEIMKETQRAEMVLKEQDFQNYLALHDYRNAILLALAMEQPGRLLSLFKNVAAPSSRDSENMDTSKTASSITGHPAVDTVIRTLPGPDLARLLRYVRDWNASARTSGVAQTVLHAVLKLRTAEDVSAAFGVAATALNDGGLHVKDSANATGLKDLVDALIPYTERHLARIDRLVQESFVVDYILGEMDDGLFGDGELMEVDTLL